VTAFLKSITIRPSCHHGL